jgi:hypothetical protein
MKNVHLLLSNKEYKKWLKAAKTYGEVGETDEKKVGNYLAKVLARHQCFNKGDK